MKTINNYIVTFIQMKCEQYRVLSLLRVRLAAIMNPEKCCNSVGSAHLVYSLDRIPLKHISTAQQRCTQSV